MEGIPRTRNNEYDDILPFIRFSSRFLNSLADWNWFTLQADYGIESQSELQRLFRKQWYEVIWWRFVLCVTIGVLSLYLLPIWGCVFCIKRRKQCIRPSDTPYSKTKHSVVALVFFVVACMLIATSSIGISAIRMLRREATVHGVIGDLIVGLKVFSVYMDQLWMEIMGVIYPDVPDMLRIISELFSRFGDGIGESIAMEVGIIPAIYNLQSFSDQLPVLSQGLGDMQQYKTAYGSSRVVLEQQLTATRNNLNMFFSSTCPGTDVATECAVLQRDVIFLTPLATFTQLPNTIPAKIATDAVIQAGLPAVVDAAVNAFESAFQGLEDTLNSNANATVSSALQEIEVNLNKSVADIRRSMDKALRFQSAIDYLQENRNSFESEAVWYLDLIFIITFFANFAAILLACAVPLGTFGKERHMHQASKFICVALVVLFLLSMFLWAAVLSTFIPGGLFYLLFGRHFVFYDRSASAFENMIRTDNIQAGFRDVQISCHYNASLYKALRLKDSGLDIEELVAIPPLSDFLDQALESTTFPRVQFFNASAMKPLVDLQKLIDDVDFEAHQSAAMADIVATDLAQFELDLRSLEASNDTGVVAALPGLLQDVETAKNMTYDMEDTQFWILNATLTAKGANDVCDVSEAAKQLRNGEKELNDNLAVHVQNVLERKTTPLIAFIEQTIDNLVLALEDDVGRCGVLYRVSLLLVIAFCWYCLEPIIVFAVAMGWFMFVLYYVLIYGPTLMDYYAFKEKEMAKNRKQLAIDEHHRDARHEHRPHSSPHSPHGHYSPNPSDGHYSPNPYRGHHGPNPTHGHHNPHRHRPSDPHHNGYTRSAFRSDEAAHDDSGEHDQYERPYNEPYYQDDNLPSDRYEDRRYGRQQEYESITTDVDTGRRRDSRGRFTSHPPEANTVAASGGGEETKVRGVKKNEKEGEGDDISWVSWV